MKLTIVGCSGSFPGPSSPASCYLLTAHDGRRTWRILLDLGSGALGNLQRYMDLYDIDAVMLSHLHPDHCMDLCGLHVAVRWDPEGWPKDRIPVYSPTVTADRMAKAYGLPLDPGMREEFDFIRWTPWQAVTVGPFSVTPIPANHADDEPYSMRVECTEVIDGQERTVTLCYSGDTDYSPELVQAADNVDLFLCEAAFQEGRDEVRGVHLTGKRAGQTATEAGAKRLLLTHLPPWTDANTVLAEARETYAKDVAAAIAGVHYEVVPDRVESP